MCPASFRPALSQPFPLGDISAILCFDLRPAVPPCRKFFSPSTFNLPTFNVPRHLTYLFSITSTLFSAMAPTQTTYFQWLAHSFPSHGGGGDRWSARSILRVYPESRRARAVASERPAHSTLVYPERFVRRATPLLPLLLLYPCTFVPSADKPHEIIFFGHATS